MAAFSSSRYLIDDINHTQTITMKLCVRIYPGLFLSMFYVIWFLESYSQGTRLIYLREGLTNSLNCVFLSYYMMTLSQYLNVSWRKNLKLYFCTNIVKNLDLLKRIFCYYYSFIYLLFHFSQILSFCSLFAFLGQNMALHTFVFNKFNNILFKNLMFVCLFNLSVFWNALSIQNTGLPRGLETQYKYKYIDIMR